jgi:citrate synthase
MSHILEQFEGPMPTRAGQVFPGQRTVFGGHDLHTTFADSDWIDLYLFGICGRRLPRAHLNVIQRLWVYTSYPDARLWCNRIGALTGSTRGTGSQAIAAGIAATEATIYGQGPLTGIADFLSRAMAATRNGASVEQMVRAELAQHRNLTGFGRPVATGFVDERIPATLAMLEREGVPVGPHLALAFEIEKTLEQVKGKRLPMTYAPIVSAIALDFGLTVRQAYLCQVPLLIAGMVPCYLEALERPSGASFVLRCERINYDGAAPRDWRD